MGKCFSKPEQTETKDSLYSLPDKDYNDELKVFKQFPKTKLSSISTATILNSLSKSYLFRNLSPRDVDNILNHVIYCVCEAGQTIFKQGDTGSLYFIINSGRVQVIVDGKKRGMIESENGFGEMALLSDSVRKATIITLTKCSFWVLTGKNFSDAMKSLYKLNYDHIRFLISNTLVFKNLPEQNIDLISKMAMKVTYEDHEKIIRLGDAGDLIYVLVKGCVAFKKGSDEYMRITKPGDIFGEGALLTGETRKATCVSIGDSEVISINFLNLKSILGENQDILLLKNLSKNTLTSDSHINFLDKEIILKICENLKWEKFQDSEKVLTKTKEPFTTLYIICTGMIKHKSVLNSEISSYQVIGLQNSNEQRMIDGDYFSIGETILGSITFLEINTLRPKLNCFEQVKKLEKIQLIRNISFFNCISETSADKLADKLKDYVVLPNTQIFSCEDRGTKVYLVKSGLFEVYNSEKKLVRIIKSNEIFGERCLYEEKRSATVICLEQAEIYNVFKSDLESLKEVAELEQQARRREYYQRKVYFQDMKVVREYLSSQGRKRFCIKDTVNKLKYELIVIPLATLETQRDCYRLIKERDIMIQVEHRQLVKLVCSSYNAHNIYFVTEHIKGNSLFNLLPVHTHICKQLFLYFVKMIEYLHEKNIAYRDFCTENIIISTNGVPYLYNFRSAKLIENRSYTKVGNPFIRSPEMIMGRGYTKSTDIWSLGVVLYEIIYNKLPFSMMLNDSPVDAYQKILKLVHGFEDSYGNDLNKLIEDMLTDSDHRIDVKSILRNHWFSDVQKDFLKKRLTLCPNIFGQKIKEVKRFKKVFKADKLLVVSFI